MYDNIFRNTMLRNFSRCLWMNGEMNGERYCSKLTSVYVNLRSSAVFFLYFFKKNIFSRCFKIQVLKKLKFFWKNPKIFNKPKNLEKNKTFWKNSKILKKSKNIEKNRKILKKSKNIEKIEQFWKNQKKFFEMNGKNW